MTQPTNNSHTNIQPAPVQPNSLILNMPLDIVVEIFKRIKWNDVGTCQLVCRLWNQLFSDNTVCRSLLENHFPFYRIPKATQNFQKAYKDQQFLNFNLINRVYASHTLAGHTNSVYSLAVLGDKLFSGSSDKTIKVWDLKTNACLATLTEHTNSVYSLAVLGDKLFSGSSDRTIRVWDLKTNACLATLAGHEGGVLSLAVLDDKLFSGSWDSTIKVWDLKTNACLATLAGHEGGVLSLAVLGDKLFSSSSDKTIKVWDLKTNACLATLTGHTNSVYSLAVLGDKLFSGSSDETIRVWDLKTNTCLATLAGHEGGVLSLAVLDDKLFSGSSDKTIKVWDLKTNACLATLAGHEGGVNCLAVLGYKLFSGSHDMTIKVWDFTTEHGKVFEELAGMLDSSIIPMQQAMDRFSRMPKTARTKIYGELYKILKPLNLIQNEGCAEHAFHDVPGQSSTHAQKAQAIRNHLEQQSKTDAHPLLQHLGIVSTHDYSIKLGCRPAHLQKIGILALEDVQLICSPSIDLQKLVGDKVDGEENLDFRENQVKAKADQRKKVLFDLSASIAQTVAKRIEETNTCGVLIYPAESPWTSFHGKCQAFQAKLEGIVRECKDLPELIVEAFKIEKYNMLVQELNILIEEFQTLDRDHQIAKLHTYINQWGILRAWENRKTRGIQGLCQLEANKQALQNLFRMGE